MQRDTSDRTATDAGRRDGVLPTATAVVPASAPGTGGGMGHGGTAGMAVGAVLLVGVGLIAAAVALVGLRGRRDSIDT